MCSDWTLRRSHLGADFGTSCSHGACHRLLLCCPFTGCRGLPACCCCIGAAASACCWWTPVAKVCAVGILVCSCGVPPALLPSFAFSAEKLNFCGREDSRIGSTDAMRIRHNIAEVRTTLCKEWHSRAICQSIGRLSVLARQWAHLQIATVACRHRWCTLLCYPARWQGARALGLCSSLAGLRSHRSSAGVD